VASVLPYDDINIDRVKVSMKIGGEYRLRNIRPYHWRKLAGELRIDPDKTMQRVSGFSARLADHISAVKRQMTKEGLDHPVIARLADDLTERAAACRRILDAA
jgi:serine/threonine-protein kinase HipA